MLILVKDLIIGKPHVKLSLTIIKLFSKITCVYLSYILKIFKNFLLIKIKNDDELINKYEFQS